MTVDGEALSPDALAEPIPLGPGTHKIVAASAGFAPAEQSLTVASGETAEVALTLTPDQGAVTIEAPDPRMTIAVDQRVVGTGTWAGPLAPGAHRVQIAGAGAASFNTDILVVANQPLTLRPGAAALLAVPLSPPVRREAPPSRRGAYVIAMGALLFPTRYPTGFRSPEVNSGGAGGVRLGYQLNGVAGFDGFFEHSSLYTPSSRLQDQGYTLISNRVGADLRLMAPGRVVRAVGVIGGGLVVDSLTFDQKPPICDAKVCTPSSGVDPFFLLEAGLEVEFSGVLLGVALQSEFQSSRGISAAGMNTAPFSNDTLIDLGPALRVGFAFW